METMSRNAVKEIIGAKGRVYINGLPARNTFTPVAGDFFSADVLHPPMVYIVTNDPARDFGYVMEGQTTFLPGVPLRILSLSKR